MLRDGDDKHEAKAGAKGLFISEGKVASRFPGDTQETVLC